METWQEKLSCKDTLIDLRSAAAGSNLYHSKQSRHGRCCGAPGDRCTGALERDLWEAAERWAAALWQGVRGAHALAAAPHGGAQARGLLDDSVRKRVARARHAPQVASAAGGVGVGRALRRRLDLGCHARRELQARRGAHAVLAPRAHAAPPAPELRCA